jgi:AcrR family transcriptional regulator
VNNVNIPRRRTYHHGNLRAALLEAALRAISEDGPEAFTLRDVARRAGVSPAAPYRHFRDKEELLAAVAGECAERLGATVAEAAMKAPNDALEQFRSTGIAVVQFAVAHPEHFRALAIPGIAARMPAEHRTQIEAWNAAQRTALAAAQKAGAVAPIPLDELCLAANALVHGLGHLIVEGQLGDVSPARAKQLAVAVTGVLGLGLLPRKREGPTRLAKLTASNRARSRRRTRSDST